jgi:hypothetical protein
MIYVLTAIFLATFWYFIITAFEFWRIRAVVVKIIKVHAAILKIQLSIVEALEREGIKVEDTLDSELMAQFKE